MKQPQQKPQTFIQPPSIPPHTGQGLLLSSSKSVSCLWVFGPQAPPPPPFLSRLGPPALSSNHMQASPGVLPQSYLGNKPGFFCLFGFSFFPLLSLFFLHLRLCRPSVCLGTCIAKGSVVILPGKQRMLLPGVPVSVATRVMVAAGAQKLDVN